MVAALKPGRFYGTALPRPHIYCGTYLNEERVDPPAPVNDAFLKWARDAHWSMGGLSFKRTRMQGKIEGRISKIRAEESSPSSTGEIHKKMKEGLKRKLAKSLDSIPEKMREGVVESPGFKTPQKGEGSKRRTRRTTMVVEEDDGARSPPSSLVGCPENGNGSSKKVAMVDEDVEGDGDHLNSKGRTPENGEGSKKHKMVFEDDTPENGTGSGEDCQNDRTPEFSMREKVSKRKLRKVADKSGGRRDGSANRKSAKQLFADEDNANGSPPPRRSSRIALSRSS